MTKIKPGGAKSQTPLYRQVASAIKQLVQERYLGPGDRLPSINNLSEQFEVSHITVRAALRVLAEEGYVESRHREGVFVQKAKVMTSSLESGKTIAVLVPYGDHVFEGGIIRGVMEQAQTAGYRVIIANSNDNPEREAAQLEELSQQVAGVIVFPTLQKSILGAYAKLIERGVAFVFVDRGVEGLSAPVVAMDNERGGFLATEHLLDLGIEQVFLLTTTAPSSAKERQQGYRRALQAQKVCFNPLWVRQLPLYTEAVGYRLAKELLNDRAVNLKSGKPFGVFAINEFIAQGCYVAFKEAGLRIPQDVAVASFDDFSALMFDPPLTAVRQQPHRIGSEATGILLDLIRGNSSSHGNRKTADVRIPPEFTVRNSTTIDNDFSLVEHWMKQESIVTNSHSPKLERTF